MTRALVMAKAPVAGRVKTRLGAEVGMAAAAELAAASLLDTIAACRDAFGPTNCHLALAGDLAAAVRGDDLAAAVADWRVAGQRGDTFAERLAHAHADIQGGAPVVQVGMDTPQLTSGHLHAAADALVDHDAVLGPAEDGGWWVLGLRRPGAATALREVPMSTPATYDDTRSALVEAGLRVARTLSLRDVDTVADAHEVARQAPDSEFGRRWAEATR